MKSSFFENHKNRETENKIKEYLVDTFLILI